MRRASFADMHCSIARTLEVVGEWWTLLIVRDAFFGVTRFEEWQERLGIARNVLTTRLETLVDAGVLERRVYDEGRDRADYVLTEKGRDLWSVMVMLRQWGDRWEAAPGGPPVAMVHDTCGETVEGALHCTGCGDRLELGELRLVDGPGADAGSLLRTPSEPPSPTA